MASLSLNEFSRRLELATDDGEPATYADFASKVLSMDDADELLDIVEGVASTGPELLRTSRRHTPAEREGLVGLLEALPPGGLS